MPKQLLMNPKKEEDMKPTEQDTCVKLTVKDLRNTNTVMYTMTRSTHLKKLMNHYNDLSSTEFSLSRFIFNGRRLLAEQTPNELQMKDGDMIDAMIGLGKRVITIRVKGQDGYEVAFMMYFESQLQVFMDFYCRRYSIDITEIAFLYNGRLLQAVQTPYELEMWSDAEIFVVVYDQIEHIKLKIKSQMETNVDNNDSTLWPYLATKTFIDIMVDEVANGNMSNGVFHTRTWISMTNKLNSITSHSYKKAQLKVEMHRLSAMYREFYLLLQNTGFVWNAETNTVIADAEIWKNYLQAHDKASQFQMEGCDHYKLLEIIFYKNSANEVPYNLSTQEVEYITRVKSEKI